MAKRKRKHKRKFLITRGRIYYPSIYCLKEKKPIGVSQIRCRKKVKVNFIHWLETNSEFLNGYRIDFTKMKKGDRVYCPVCAGLVDFRMFMSDTIPHMIQPKVKNDKQNNSEESSKTQEYNN